MSLVNIWIGHAVFRSLFEHTIDMILPELWSHMDFHGRIDLRRLAYQLSELVPTPPSLNTTIKILKSFFGQLSHNHNLNATTLATKLIPILDSLLQQDCWHQHARGLRQSRNNFVTLAFLAQMTESQPLATILIDLFWGERRTIVGSERSMYLTEWVMAIEALRHITSSHKINKCIHYIARRRDDIRNQYRNSGHNDPHFDMIIEMLFSLNEDRLHRGRSFQRRWLPAPRARTTPPAFLPLPPPDHLAVGYPSPTPSMNYALDGDYRDAEIHQLRLETEAMKDQLHSLEIHQAETDMELALADRPLQLGWH